MSLPGIYVIPTHYRNDTFEGVEFTVNLNGSPLDLTGVVIEMMLRRTLQSATPELTLSTGGGGITITDAVNGVFQIDEQIIAVDAWQYQYDIQFTFPDTTVMTYIRGTWKIEQDVTYA